MSSAFDHRQAAHCETGVVSALLRGSGLEISEPMVFGLSGGLTFAYIGFVKINGMPLISYRMPPMMILRLLSMRVKGLQFECRKFRSEKAGMDALEHQISEGQLVGLQTSVFFLPYFPKEMRFHFNAHNVLVYGKQAEQYQVSDPIFSHVMEIDEKSLEQARFCRGALAPKGMMYHPTSVPQEIDYERVIPKALRFTYRLNGRKNPVPIAGIAGMRNVAKRIDKLDQVDPRYARLFLGYIFRMQEEIGTGGAGFRFMFAAFLEEAGQILSSDLLTDVSKEMISVGDEWRRFALMAARKSQDRDVCSFADIAGKLRDISHMEADVYDKLSKFKAK